MVLLFRIKKHIELQLYNKFLLAVFIQICPKVNEELFATRTIVGTLEPKEAVAAIILNQMKQTKKKISGTHTGYKDILNVHHFYTEFIVL